MRGVVVCNACGCRLEHYTDYVHFIAEAYGGDWKSANEYAHEDARIKVAQKWNRRAWCDRDALLALADEMEEVAQSRWEAGHKGIAINDADRAARIREALGVES